MSTFGIDFTKKTGHFQKLISGNAKHVYIRQRTIYWYKVKNFRKLSTFKGWHRTNKLQGTGNELHSWVFTASEASAVRKE